jgi:two-component system alkaline phosphatase synthesis response regulator PhoP
LTKVLIVEDNLSIVKVTRILLEREGFLVESCADERCFELARTWAPSIILMDVRLPGLDGIEACLTLKKDELTKHIPVIMVSADGDIEELAAEACADGILSKPFSNKSLIGIIRAHSVDGAVN